MNATTMEVSLGAFSVSLAVKDLEASNKFYQKLGFEAFAGAISHNFLMMKSGNTVIGLFQGKFPKNILTFNPGWDQSGQTLPEFQDVRELQEFFKSQGLMPTLEVAESTKGPGYLMLRDPDGNDILIDQHV